MLYLVIVLQEVDTLAYNVISQGHNILEDVVVSFSRIKAIVHVKGRVRHFVGRLIVNKASRIGGRCNFRYYKGQVIVLQVREATQTDKDGHIEDLIRIQDVIGNCMYTLASDGMAIKVVVFPIFGQKVG